MQTFVEALELVDNPGYLEQRRATLAGLQDGMLDVPIIGLINALNRLDCCFTLQCCYGHFLYPGQEDEHNLARLPAEPMSRRVDYRIAYVAFCVENSPLGRQLLWDLRVVAASDRGHVQFGSATWFWERQVNSYVLQVEPIRFRHCDRMVLDYREALVVESSRNRFYKRLAALPARFEARGSGTA